MKIDGKSFTGLDEDAKDAEFEVSQAKRLTFARKVVYPWASSVVGQVFEVDVGGRSGEDGRAKLMSVQDDDNVWDYVADGLLGTDVVRRLFFPGKEMGSGCEEF